MKFFCNVVGIELKWPHFWFSLFCLYLVFETKVSAWPLVLSILPQNNLRFNRKRQKIVDAWALGWWRRIPMGTIVNYVWRCREVFLRTAWYFAIKLAYYLFGIKRPLFFILISLEQLPEHIIRAEKDWYIIYVYRCEKLEWTKNKR